MSLSDPLAINLLKQTRALLALLPKHSPHFSQISLAPSPRALLSTLSRLLAVPSLTVPISDLFRPLLVDLCARWLHDIEDIEDRFIALCMLIEIHQELFPILSAFLRRPCFAHGPLGFVEESPSVVMLDAIRLHDLLLAYYRLLRANRLLPSDLSWPISCLSMLFTIPHPDITVKYLAIRCYSLCTGMAEVERVQLETRVLGQPGTVDCPLSYGQNIDGSRNTIDGWLMPIMELKRVHQGRNAVVISSDFYLLHVDVAQPLTDSDLSPWIANIHGVLILKSSPSPPPSMEVVTTPSAIKTLRQLAILTSLRLPTLVTSPPSSGKSLFLSHLASVMYPDANDQIVTVHLADTSLDPRSLLGSYVSSPTQLGTFEWKDGVLVRAMREGKWLVFEDIDHASMEVLGLIKPLSESLAPGTWIGNRACIDVPNRGKVRASERFAIFATRSVTPSTSGSFPSPIFYGAHKFQELTVDAPSSDETKMIIESRFPKLGAPFAQAIIQMWAGIQGLGTTALSRSVGLRELEKYCRRVEALISSAHSLMNVETSSREIVPIPTLFPNLAFREELFLEARDVFFGAGALTAPARAYFDRVAVLVGNYIGLDSERRRWLLGRRVPALEEEKDGNGDVVAVSIGRVRLSARPPRPRSLTAPTRPFVVHKPAVCLLSRISTSISLCEPILLTGETGTGKTSAITHLASLLSRPLISLNLSHQTESSDLLGGFKPVDARLPASVLHAEFLKLFGNTFSRKKNIKFEESVRKAVQEGKWKRVVFLWRESVRLAKERIESKLNEDSQEFPLAATEADGPRKRRKLDQVLLQQSTEAWNKFQCDIDKFDVQHIQGQGKFAFDFVDGPLVKALRSGDWILLDEINLASPETLECITGLLSGPTASICLTEKGTLEVVPRHPDFRLFACMNPATDVGKKDLPPNIRARFTEIDVPPPDADRETLLIIIHQYIGHCTIGDKAAIMNVADFYTALKHFAEDRQLADGSNHRPHYSMRTLARALTFAADIFPTFGLRRALWESCLMAFTMVLDAPSADIVTGLAKKHILSGVRNPKSLLAKEPSFPTSRSSDEFVKFGPFYLEKGPLDVDLMEDYIMTPSVEKKLTDLARIVLTRRFPVLIEGPTSSGKTSAVEYLARRTGHQFIRINNHEHTDIQEYIGSYVSDPASGKLAFKDGLLIHALRHGHWIVLDELNLAPTDVLEALNRLLDDNRELVIPETHEVVRPHPHFMLFATQNPPGLYAGRKVLSRAFRNRFLEVHFQDVPQAELESILCQRCRIAPSYGQKIVSVFQELQKRRQTGRVFESKQGFATLRDLFRWAGRDAIGYQELAENGYMLLAERARRMEDKQVVKEVIETVMKVRIDEKSLYNLLGRGTATYIGCSVPSSPRVVWTYAMRRLFVLVSRALRFNEPVLLVGETGSGKTSVCQLYAEAASRQLHTLSCHQNTETADLIGGLRPLRSRGTVSSVVYHDVSSLLARAGVASTPTDIRGILDQISVLLKTELESSLEVDLRALQKHLLVSEALFEWHDGPLIRAMRDGDVFLLDEISLADDSVLERLNSVLEPDRTIVLAERGGMDGEYPAVRAVDSFKLLATMNPGGDYGKKELSPALRNRFTEIWVSPVDDPSDIEMIVESFWISDTLKVFTAPILRFSDWLCDRIGDRSICSLRDILAWVAFSNAVFTPNGENTMSIGEIFHQGAHMTFLDRLGSLPQTATYSLQSLRQIKEEAIRELSLLVPLGLQDTRPYVYDPSRSVQFGPFALPKGPADAVTHNFNLQAPTAYENALRVVRACQVRKPILLEGSPGVGKTSLIATLAKIAGYHLCRINLSDQTDLIDLFGSDLPVESGAPGEFAWKDAEFLQALQYGHWVLLDEMNLAPQSVLEGLNAVLDHRGTVYIPELGRNFTRHPSFRVFAAQNPLHQGGGRKGLPRSFLDRFTKVHVEELAPDDMLVICRELSRQCDEHVLRAMIAFNTRLNHEIVHKRSFGREGSPWEFNLRDIIRWGELLRASSTSNPRHFIRIVYLSRFRNLQDRAYAQTIFDEVFSTSGSLNVPIPHPIISSSHLQIGYYNTRRHNVTLSHRTPDILQVHLTAIEAIGACLSRSWLVVVTGSRESGKTNLIRTLANLSGNHLDEVHISKATDTTDILGGFEQVDHFARIMAVAQEVIQLTETFARSICGITSKYQYREIVQHELISDRRTHASILQAVSDVLAQLSTIEVDDPSLDIARRELEFKVHELTQARSTKGRFEWIDGPLIQAMKNGHWLVLDDANMCNPSVLDRLNSLCEPNGNLVLTERGLISGEVLVLTPHSNFRLLMTIDPQYGELSRAMRNRSVEVSLLNCFTEEDRSRVLSHCRLPAGLTTTTSCYESHEKARRGILSLYSHDLSLYFPPVGIDHDSTLSTLAVYLPFMDISDLKTPSALVYFAVRSFPTPLHWIFRRYLDVSSPNGLLYSVLADPAFCEVSKTLALSVKKVSSILPRALDDVLVSIYIAGRPMDDFMVYPPCPCCTEREVYCSYHALKLEILRLFAALLLDKSASSGWEHGALAKCSPNLIEALKSILAEVRAVAQVLLEQLLSGLFSSRSDFSKSAELLSISRKLRQVLAQKELDYSYIQVLSKLISKALVDHSSAYQPLACASTVLENAISPSSGLGLVDMWSQLRGERLTEISTVSMELLAHLPLEAVNPASRREQLEVLAVATLPMWLKPDKAEHIFGQTKNWVSRVPEGDTGLNGTSNPISLLVELRVLCNLRAENMGVIIPILQRLIGIALEEPNEDLRRFASYQHVIWCHDADHNISPGILAALMTRWLEALWHKESKEELVNGPHIIFRPTHLFSVLEKSQIVGVSLVSLGEHEELVKRHIRLTILQCYTNTSRLQELTALFNQIVLLVISCFATSFDETTYNQICADLHKDNIEASKTLLGALRQTGCEPLRKAFLHLTATLQCNADTLSSPEAAISCLGRCWIGLSRVILDLFVPDIPIDPAAMIRHATVYAQEQADVITQQIALHLQLERRTAANKTNDVISYLETSTKDLLRTVHNSSNIPTRSDLSSLRTYWQEVSRFLNQVIHPSKIDDLTRALESKDASALDREVVVQESISGFCQRIETLYVEFEDITCILRLAFAQLRLGLRLMCLASQQSSLRKHSTELAITLAMFPSARSAQLLQTISVPSTSLPAAELVILKVAAAVHCGLFPSALTTVRAAYEQVYRLWSIDRARDKQRELDLNSLYRANSTTHDISTEAENEEKEFLELFPTFEDALQSSDISAMRTNNKPVSHLTLDRQQQLLALHLELMSNSVDLIKIDRNTSKFLALRQTFLRSWISDHFSLLPDSIDTKSLHLQLSILHGHLMKIFESSKSHSKFFNFYTDENIQEAKKASDVVQSLRTRLVDILRDWPDQMVLQHLIDRCDMILAFNLASPIAKVLSAIEQLLMQAEDWEMYANRDNSIREHQNKLTSLIVEWRRLELSCWKGLLESQNQSFIGHAAEFWFRLYEVLIRGPLDAVQADANGESSNLDGYLRQLPSLLDEFIQSSSLGQFQIRLDLLHSFESFICRIAPQEPYIYQGALLQVSRIVHFSWRYFHLFVNGLSTLLKDQRKALEKEVEAFIKLASWKDVNVQALKQSAQRTHHQLYKIIRKFREVLRQPVTGKMNPLFTGDVESHHYQVERPVFPSSPPLPSGVAFADPALSSASTPSHLRNIHETFGKFDGFIGNTIRHFLSQCSVEDVEQLSLDIILTSRNLANHTIPPDLTKEKREKYKKNLLLRKRKAWSDLLKELKRSGLAQNVKPDILNGLRDECWIRNQPLMPTSSGVASAEKAEHYFDRLRGCLPALRNVLADHHSDLGTRDLSRGISLVESGYSLALEGRSELCYALSAHSTFRRQVDRLQALAEHSETIVIDACDKIGPLHDALNLSICALEELVEGIRIFSELEKSIGVVPDLIEKCQALIASARIWQDRVSKVLRSSQAIIPCVLLRDDFDDAVGAAGYLSELPGQLEEMSVNYPQLIYIFQPTQEWIHEQGSFSFTQLIRSPPEGDVAENVDTIIDALLVAVQSMLRRCSESNTPTTHESGEARDSYIRIGVQTTSHFTALLDLATLGDRLNSASTYLSCLPHASRQRALRRVMPFLSCFSTFAGGLVESLARWTCALFKLDHIVCSVVYTLGTQGFCIPPEIEDGEAVDDEKGHAIELGGTGLGEGIGNENVSKEIEDEGQVEGLQGEDDSNGEMQKERGKDEENTIEMSENFEGEMEDVPEAEENGEAEKKEEEEPDEQLGKLDKSDPTAVDEKLWGSEEGKDDGGGEDEMQNNKPQEKQQDDSNIAAKEEDRRKEKKVKNPTDAKEEKQRDGKVEEEEMDVNDEDEDEDEMEPPDAAGASMDQHIPDASTLDLPDDMHLDDEINRDDNEDGAEIERLSNLSDDDASDDQDAGEEREKDHGVDDGPMSAEPENTEHHQRQVADENEMDEGKDNFNEESKENAVAQPDLTAGDGDGGASENEPKDSAPDGQQSSASTKAEINVDGGDNSRKSDPEEQPSGDNVENQPQPQPRLPSTTDTQPQSFDRNSGEGAQHGPAHASQPPLTLPSSPLRSLGDVLEAVQQRFDEIFGPADQTQPLPVPQHEHPEQVEYAHHEDAQESNDMLALGPAGEEEVAKLRELKLVDEGKDKTDTDAMDIDQFDFLDGKQELKEAKDIAMERLEAKKMAEHLAPDIEDAIVHTEKDGDIIKSQSHHHQDPSAPKAEDDTEPESEISSSESVVSTLADHASNPTPSSASHLWTLYTTLTASLSLALCESLRLILAPTLATRLRGDFRTGKKLNMRKVVGWVASEYTKDRIWMRRVKPSSREYQVLLAVDDSASMRNGGGGGGGAVHLAYQTVVLVVQALGKLEVGEVGVARFGEGWELVRGFGSDTTGAKDWGSSPIEGGRVLNSFTFSQSRTDVAAFLEGSLSVLEAARENSTNTSGRELWQLEIIISDGICQDHERLRRILRKARGMRVLVVFIVIDALNNAPSALGVTAAPNENQSSILTLSQVSYKPSPTTGQMELTMERYLDTFPFEYYVVLRDVGALPRVLADTLREFFERVNEE